jgi:hypothetical protein
LVLVGVALVPQEQARPGVVVAELAQEVEDLRAADVLFGIQG